MNEKFHTYIQKAGDEISLTHTERTRMRGMLHAYMEMKPLRGASSTSRFALSNWIPAYRPIAAVLVLGLFASSAGVSFAAEHALPGDVLYAIKTRINEPIKGALALSASAKTQWATSVAGERIQEATTLAAQGRLDDATQGSLQKNFQEHAAIAENNIENEAKTSPQVGAEAATRFEAQLSEYQRVLTNVALTKHVKVAALASSVETQDARIAQIRSSAQDEVALATSSGNAIAASRMQVAAKEGLGISAQLARTVSAALDASSARSISVQLDDASATISEGDALLKQDSTPDALSAFQNALVASEKLGVFLKTSSAIHARTGLVIGEPGTRGSAKASSTRAAANFNANKDGKGKVHGTGPIQAALMNTSSATSDAGGNGQEMHTSAEPMQTTAFPQESSKNHEGGKDKNKGSNTDQGNDTESSDSHVLPLPVPTSLVQ